MLGEFTLVLRGGRTCDCDLLGCFCNVWLCDEPGRLPLIGRYGAEFPFEDTDISVDVAAVSVGYSSD